MKLNRRAFLKTAASASVALAVGLPVIASEPGTHYMKQGEVLRDIYHPSWKKIILANDCVITGCIFKDTEIVGRSVSRCMISFCSWDFSHADRVAVIFR